MSDFYPVLTENKCGAIHRGWFEWTFENNELRVTKDDSNYIMTFPSVKDNGQFEMFKLGMSMYCHSKRFVQDCFPSLTADEREYIITGITPEVWELIFEVEELRQAKEDLQNELS